MARRLTGGRSLAGSLALVGVLSTSVAIGSPTAHAVESRVTAVPVVVTNPTDQTVTFDDVPPTTTVYATFTAAATGHTSMLWQISDDGVGPWTTIAGESTDSLVVTAGLGTAGDRYRAGFVNGDGTVFTAPATLIMNTESGAPRTLIHPPDRTALNGGAVTFYSTATGNPAPTVAWAYTEPGASTSEYVPGASGESLTVPVTAAMNGREYFAVFSNVHGLSGSRAATLTVAPAATAPTITEQPADQHVLAGVTAVFSAAADGAPTPTVQWEVSTDGSTWNALSGANSPELTLLGTNVTQDGHRFRAVFTTAGTLTATTATATLAVSPGPDAAPTVTTDPTDQSVIEGSDATFTAAADGTPTPTVQWEVSTDGGGSFTPLAGATNTTLTVAAATLTQNANRYRAVFANGVAPDATTQAATLTVTAAPAAPTIVDEPADVTVVEGTTATFTASANGTPTPTVQWEVSTDGGTTYTPVPGATTTTLTLSGTTLAMSGSRYRAVFTNTVDSVEGIAAVLTVTPASVGTAPVVTTHPADLSVVEGTDAVFTAAATGTPTPTVQWQVSIGGGPFTDLLGATTTTLTVTAATIAQSGHRFRAVFSNGIAPDAATDAATLTVTTGGTTPPPPPVVIDPHAPEPVNVCDPDAPVPAGYRLIPGTSDNDVLKGTAGPDLIRGLGGNDVIRAGGGDDIVCGGDGDDTVFGGAGRDIVSGGAGSDTVKGGAGADALYGGAGNDQLFGGGEKDLLDGGTGRDLERGGPGRNRTA